MFLEFRRTVVSARVNWDRPRSKLGHFETAWFAAVEVCGQCSLQRDSLDGRRTFSTAVNQGNGQHGVLCGLAALRISAVYRRYYTADWITAKDWQEPRQEHYADVHSISVSVYRAPICAEYIRRCQTETSAFFRSVPLHQGCLLIQVVVIVIIIIIIIIIIISVIIVLYLALAHVACYNFYHLFLVLTLLLFTHSCVQRIICYRYKGLIKVYILECQRRGESLYFYSSVGYSSKRYCYWSWHTRTQTRKYCEMEIFQ